MIQTHLFLDKNTTLFKNLKKRGHLQYNDSLLIWLNIKPSIGELIEISSSTVTDYELKKFLSNRNKRIILRIIDLLQLRFNLGTQHNGIDTLHLKCYEDSADWI